MTSRELVEEFGSPVWVVDLDAARAALDAVSAAFAQNWPATSIAYSYKTNRTLAVLQAMAVSGADADVVCEAEYLLARDVVGLAGDRIVVNGPVKSTQLLAWAADDGALVVVDTAAELERAAAIGVDRVGLRVAQPGIGQAVSRFGISVPDIPAACARARALGLRVESLSTHLVSTDFVADAGEVLARSVAVRWPRASDDHVAAARLLGRMAVALDVPTVNLGGGHPPAPQIGEHARRICMALEAEAFTGQLVLEPGRAIVADAVDLVATVVARKVLDDGRTCLVVDAGTNLLPATIWGWPRLDAPPSDAGRETVLVSGPLCLNTDVLHPHAELPTLGPGDQVVARGVGAYQQVHSSQFGDLRPAVVAIDTGLWRQVRRRETVDDLIAGEQLPHEFVHAVPNNDREVER